MKRIISLIIAASLFISLIPAVYAAQKAETISYKINSNSISTEEVSPSSHFIPVETDEESENYGDLKLELRTFTDSGNTTTYETTGYKYAEPTFKNLILNFDGDFTGLSSSISNNELGMISYRSISYWKYVSGKNATIKNYHPFRKFLASTMTLSGMKFGKSWGLEYVSGSPIERTLPPSIDLSKTAPFELYGKGLSSSHAWLDANGYFGSYSFGSITDPDLNYSKFGTVSGPCYPVRIKIPDDAVAGKYTLTVGNTAKQNPDWIYGDFNAAVNNVYVTKIDSEAGFEGMFDGYGAKGGLFANFADNSGKELDRAAYAADENLFGQYIGTNNAEASFEKEIEIAPGEEYIVYFEIDKNSVDPDALNATAYTDIPADGKKFEDINVYVRGGYLYQSFKLSYIDLVPVPEEDAEYKESFDAVVDDNYISGGKATVNAYTYTDKETALSIGNTVNLGESVELTAPEISGYNFLYWAKGAIDKKQVISYNKKLTYKPGEGANYVVAVYEEENAQVNKAEFYNANGSLIATLNADGNAPELPSMAGYNRASGWQLYGTDDVVAAGESITVSGNMIFVAKYAKTPDTVIVNDTEYTYGTVVTMPEIDAERIFKGWKRNDEIVSIDPDYTFRAWENATVEPVYADSTPVFSGNFMKIIIDDFTAGDEKAIMAEFVGMDDAVEKGIIINDTKKISMKGNGSQFSIIADVVGTYIGYAILKNGAEFSQVTDGSFTK